tara:strand:- start:168 stop:404 length:237 start_codon:yes stop_codon:yes gene_type:complete
MLDVRAAQAAVVLGEVVLVVAYPHLRKVMRAVVAHLMDRLRLQQVAVVVQVRLALQLLEAAFQVMVAQGFPQALQAPQ